jgi:hypothetical protein
MFRESVGLPVLYTVQVTQRGDLDGDGDMMREVQALKPYEAAYHCLNSDGIVFNFIVVCMSP